MDHGPTPILFFDGQCGLCDRSVRWCLRHDRRGVLRYAPLQGETYAAMGRPGNAPDLDSLVLVDHQGAHVHSEAVLRIARICGGPWKTLAAVGRLIPKGLRDAMYRAIARRRIRWFGGADACELPKAGHVERMLP